MALKSRSYILDLDHVKLSLEKKILCCLVKSLLHQLSITTFIFVTHQKAANLMFRLVLPAGLVSIKSCEVEFSGCSQKGPPVLLKLENDYVNL